MLNIIWPIFIIISYIYALFSGNIENINNGIFESCKSAVELTITFFGTITLWCGIMQIAQDSSLSQKLTKLLSPLIKFLFPDIPKTDPAYNQISLNIIANILGLGNAATPLGLKAMESLQKKNTSKDTLSNSMAMLILLNTASLQLIPTTVIAIRSSLNSENPTAIIVPVWLSTVCAATCRYFSCKILYQNWKIGGGITMAIINYISIIAVPFVIFFIISYALSEKIKVFDSFLVGCKEGINTVIKIFPTLIALFLAISALRNSGILDLLGKLLSPILNILKIPSEILPLILIRPISGSASTAVAMDIMQNYGVDTIIRSNCFYDYGFYRNHSLYNRNLYKFGECKENSICFNSCYHCRYSPECLLLSCFVEFCRRVFLDFCLILRYYVYKINNHC